MVWTANRFVAISVKKGREFTRCGELIRREHTLIRALGDSDVVNVRLMGEWTDVKIDPGMVFAHLVRDEFSADNSSEKNDENYFGGNRNTSVKSGEMHRIEEEHCIIVDSSVIPVTAMIVVLPDTLVSATTISDAASCLRKAVLNSFFSNSSGTNADAIKGNLIHELFQEFLVKEWNTLKDQRIKIEKICKKYTFELFGIGMTTGEAIKILEDSVPLIIQCKKHHINNVEQKVELLDVVDIEMCACSPQFGLKGKIDAVMKASFCTNKHEVIIPLELKTGYRTHFGHNAQVLLYVLMLLSWNQDSKATFGILKYLSEKDFRVVSFNYSVIVSLIISRNIIAYHLEKLQNGSTHDVLPPLLRDKNVCSKCYQKDVCFLYDQAIEKRCKTDQNEVFKSIASTLTSRGKEYMYIWMNLIAAENSEHQQEARNSFTVHPSSDSFLSSNAIGETLYKFKIIESRTDKIVLGESISLTICIDPRSKSSAYCHGIVKQITDDFITVQAYQALPRFLLSRPQSSFKIQNIGKSSHGKLMRSNLIQFLTQRNSNVTDLRDLIVELKEPKYHKFEEQGLLYDLPLPLQSEFESLNSDQKSVIKKALATDNYLLVLGMPGTGKSTTIVLLIQILLLQGKSILVTSHTNNAVDNILRKLVKYECCAEIIRIGGSNAISKDIMEEESIMKICRDIDKEFDLNVLLKPGIVVGITCWSVGTSTFRPLFENSKVHFDYCIVDEATQIPEPVILGPLMLSSKFILVGDHYQLPPLTKSTADTQDMRTSLFTRLSHSSFSTNSIICLRYQYRMNYDIMLLSNSLIYSHQLRCASEKIAQLKLSSVFPNWEKCILTGSQHWLYHVINLEQSVCIVDTSINTYSWEESDPRHSFSNNFECELVRLICSSFISIGIDQSSLGVISPYRAQLEIISDLFQNCFKNIEICTIDQYQGRDQTCIIISFVRTKSCGDLLRDWRRLNVAITRAKLKLILIMNISVLRESPILNALVSLAEQKRWVVQLPNVSFAELDHMNFSALP